MGQIRRRARRIAVEVYTDIQRLAGPPQRHGASEIKKWLDEQYSPDKVPSIKTIQRVIRENVPQDDSSPWQLADADDPADAALVLPVLATIGDEVLRWQLTQAEAKWVIRIRKAASDLPLIAVPQLVWAYMLWEDRARPTSLLDLVLAVRPWRSFETQQALERTLAQCGEDGQDAIRLVRRIEMLDLLGRIGALKERDEDERKQRFTEDLYLRSVESIKAKKEQDEEVPKEAMLSALFALIDFKLRKEQDEDAPSSLPIESLYEGLAHAKEDMDNERSHPKTGKQMERRPRRGTGRRRKA